MNPTSPGPSLRRWLILLCALAPLTAGAQDEGWQWRASVYGWLPDIAGKTRFPAGPTDIEVEVDTLVDNLNFTTMIGLDGQKGRWGVFTDVLYMDLGNTETMNRSFTVGGMMIPADVTLDTRFDLKSWVWTLAGTFEFAASDSSQVELLFGARLVDIDQQLDWRISGDIGPLPLPGREGTSGVEASNWDAVVGAKGHWQPGGAGSPWVVPWYVDVGTGDSDLTWQAMVGVGYSFKRVTVLLNWRRLVYELPDDKPIREFEFDGPMVGASFAF